MVLYDLLLVIIGIFIGVIASDPLKKLFTGGFKEDIRQKKRVKLLLYLREDTKYQKPSTSELAEKVFNGKESEETVHELLKEIEGFGLIKSISRKNDQTKRWVYTKSSNN
ncbi:hypothetical protein [Salipaludibacillus daqingensis]|uniref:hypothetical protein n=1 Tax=Salipaludibacillus daqingensis TaxID=3041001 RepID=UPI00247519DA|nr:hypothetical protein [Salipaludibacillus daqingensis]